MSDTDEEVVNALINWLNTFSLPHHLGSLFDLCDGNIPLTVLSQISADHFDENSFPSTFIHGGNWALSATNIKKLLRMIDEYYRTILHKRVLGIDDIDATLISKPPHNIDEIILLVELMVGVAVMCENKAAFIQNIFALRPVDQSVLKGIIEQVMQRIETVDIINSGQITTEQESEAFLRQEDIIRHLQLERENLSAELQTLRRLNDSLTCQGLSMKTRIAQYENEKEAEDRSDRARDVLTATRAESLQEALDDAQRELDIRQVACDALRSDVSKLAQKLDLSMQKHAKLEMENHQLSDELDVARDKAIKLAKAEAQIDKYQKRLEDLVLLKKENKELVEKLDQYIDKIHELESANKNQSSMQNIIEQYKDKAVEMERHKFEAVSALQMHQHEYQRMERELEDLVEGKKFLEEELSSVRAELEQHMAVAAELNSSSFDCMDSPARSSAQILDTESVTSLREKVKLLEIELREAHKTKKLSSVSNTDFDAGSEADSTVSIKTLSAELAMIRAELEITSSAKIEREEMLIASKKTISELQLELNKMSRAVKDVERNELQFQTNISALKELEQKLALSENTLKLLEGNMKEKEGLVNRLEQDKSKLETFSKSTLFAFKEKYMKALKGINDEKKCLEERLAVMIENNERNQVTSRREERLMLSALFEVGVKIMVSLT